MGSPHLNLRADEFHVVFLCRVLYRFTAPLMEFPHSKATDPTRLMGFSTLGGTKSPLNCLDFFTRSIRIQSIDGLYLTSCPSWFTALLMGFLPHKSCWSNSADGISPTRRNNFTDGVPPLGGTG